MFNQSNQKTRRSLTAFCILCLQFIAQSAFSQAQISYGTSSQTYVMGVPITPLTPASSGSAATVTGQASTFAGTGTAGAGTGAATSVGFYHPIGIAFDAAGNMYVADQANNMIRKITPQGMVSTLAGTGAVGSGNGPGNNATFNMPSGVCVDASGNVYVTDEGNNVIRKIAPDGTVSTLAGSGAAGYDDGQGTAATFDAPTGICIDSQGNLYVCDYAISLIRKITAQGAVTTIAGNRTQGSQNLQGIYASFHNPYGIAIDNSGNLYVADRVNHMIRKITSDGMVSTYAGNGISGFTNSNVATSASFSYPQGVAVDAQGNVYVADAGNNVIRMITPLGVVSTLSGSGIAGALNGIGTTARFGSPQGVATDQYGVVYVGDYGNNLIRKVASTPYTITPFLPSGLTFNGNNGTINGTPTALSTASTYTVTAYSAAGNGTANLSLAVIQPTPVVPSQNMNYIVTYAPRVPNLTSTGNVLSASTDDNQVQTAVQYFDGLGRPLQTVQVEGSPLGYDIVQPIAYDQYGREATKYQPYTATTNDGSYKPNAIADQASFYKPSGSGPDGSTQGNGVVVNSSPYSQTGFEPSPLDRPVEQGAPGNPWQLSTSGVTGSGHTVKIAYQSNDTSTPGSASGFGVQLYTVNIDASGNRTLANTGTYNAGTLYVTVTMDENWSSSQSNSKLNTTEEYKDLEGHVVLKRTFNDIPATANTAEVFQVLSTYYVYDDLGNLAFVLTPQSNPDAGLTSASNQTMLNNLCYQYSYDERNRLTQKKLPGKDWEYMVYNQLDQVAMTQDGNQRKKNWWTVIKHDGQGRVIVTGVIEDDHSTPFTIAQWQSAIYAAPQWDTRDASNNTGANPTGYVINSYPVVSWPLTVNYYDDYNFPGGNPYPYSQTNPSVPATASTMTTGLLTGTRTAVLPPDGSIGPMLWSVHYYDDLGRDIQTCKQHYLGGTVNAGNYDAVTTTYDFTNAPITVTRKHYAVISGTQGLAATIFNRYIYDHAGRKLKTWEQLNGGTMTLISRTDYNEIGQAMTKHLHATTDSVNDSGFLQKINYAYNERGWLSKINDPTAPLSTAQLFAEQLNYNTTAYGATPQYNGNIAEQAYENINNGVTTPAHTTYTYDYLNRLTAGNASAGNSENSIAYDLNGNITALTRAGYVNDQLGYTYMDGGLSNQIASISDAAGTNPGLANGTTTFGNYDPNGNMLSMTNTINTARNKSFTYNLLNLPETVTVPNGTISYAYDASGNKLRKVAVINGATSVTDYISGIQYKANSTSIDFIQTEEGRVLPYSSSWNYEYTLTDHLGNNRVTFDQVSGKTSEDDYYPFGYDVPKTSNGNNYLYNKKELQQELSEYDYGARFYDPVIARWTSVDPLAEIDKLWSPYNYGVDNSVKFTDPDGMRVLGPFDNNRCICTVGPGDENGDKKGSGPTVVPGPNGLGPRDKKRENRNPATGEPEIFLNEVSIQDKGLAKPISWATGKYGFSNKEIDDGAMTELSFVGGEIGGEFVGPAIRWGRGLFSSAEIGTEITTGFRSFSAFKRFYGPAESGFAWHHIVEQTPGNIARFGSEMIHNPENLMQLEHGAGSIHARISGFYSSKQWFSEGLTVRQWLAPQTFEQQFDFGVKTLYDFGWHP